MNVSSLAELAASIDATCKGYRIAGVEATVDGQIILNLEDKQGRPATLRFKARQTSTILGETTITQLGLSIGFHDHDHPVPN